VTVQIVDVSECKKNLVAEVPPDQVEHEIARLAKDYAQKAKVPGFRPGKVPLNIIRQRFGSELWHEATDDIIRRSWQDALAEHNLKPLAEPVVQDVQGHEGEPLKFTVVFETMPPVEVKDYKGVAVTVPKPAIEDAEVDRTVERLRDNHAQFIPVENSEAQDGHHVTINAHGEFEGGGKPVDEDDITLVIGDAETNAAFSDNLRGARVSDVRTFDVSYPEGSSKRFSGKTVHYTVTVKEIKDKQLSELNDDFAKDVGAENLDALKSRIRDELITKAKHGAEKKARDAALDDIVARHRFDVPECLIEDELREHARRVATTLAQQGVDFKKAGLDWKKLLDEERPRAEQEVRRSIVLDTIARQEGLETTDEEVDHYLEDFAQQAQKSVAAIKAQFEKDERIQGLRDALRRNKTLDFIYRNANITEG
jgi:trigger factor